MKVEVYKPADSLEGWTPPEVLQYKGLNGMRPVTWEKDGASA